MIRALQIIMEHCKLRASTDAIDFIIDEVNPKFMYLSEKTSLIEGWPASVIHINGPI